MSTIKAHQAYCFDIEYYNNSEFNTPFTIVDSDGNAVDLSGKKVSFTVKKKTTTSSKKIDISTDSELSLSGVGNNIITPSGAYDLPDNLYVFELYNVTDDEPLGYGKFIVIHELN